MILLFDAANTLIHKPKLFSSIVAVLGKYGYKIKENEVERMHKLVSELYDFPDKTSKEFYAAFNKDLLYSLGVLPTEELLNEIFASCSYLPWQPYADTSILSENKMRKAVLSNFHGGLTGILDKYFPGIFESISISEEVRFRKPDIRFFEHAIETLSVLPSEIIYIGDSIKLDLEPALQCGMNAWLVDRNNLYPHCERRINSFKEIQKLL